LVIAYIQANERPLYLRRYANKVREDFSIVSARMVILAIKHEQSQHHGTAHNSNTEPIA
jgi:hypothetical protein